MKIRRRLLWLAGMFIVLTAVLVFQTQTALSKTETPQVFLPVIYKDPTQTPTATATATATVTVTPTATNTPLPDPPPFPTSYYIQRISGTAVFDLGCALGLRDFNMPGKQDSLVILDFRQMWIDNGVYGIVFWDPTIPDWHNVPFSEVENIVRQYVMGYWSCSQTDRESQVTVGIGTNSYGNYGTGTYDLETLKYHGRIFGEKLASSVQALNTWAIQNGYASQVAITGAIDIEWDCSTNKWNHPDVVRTWIDGFTAKATHNEIYFNFGACVGCPSVYSPTWTYPCTTRPQPWSQDLVWWVSEGAPPAKAIPEIYRNDGYLAKQWQAVSLYGALNHSIPINFPGLMTMWQACQQVNSYECTREDGYGLDNTPAEGWLQLYIEINSNPLTAQEVLQWVTDIRYQ